MPREIVIKTDYQASPRVEPVRSESPEILGGAPSDGEWLAERASVALSDLLSSLKIDPTVLSASPKDQKLKANDLAGLATPRTSESVHALNEGKLSVRSHPLSTCSV